MSIFDMIGMAVRNLWKRKLRTFLTVLGVIIGTASIVVMISIGIGMNESYKKQLEQMGSLQVINVSVPYGGGGRSGMVIASSSSSSSSGKKGDVVIDSRAIEAFRQIDGVETATPVLDSYMQIICGKYMNDVSFKGIDPDSMEALGYKISEGRLFTDEDKMGLLVGQQVIQNFYNPKLNRQMRYNSPSPEVDLLNDKVSITFDPSYGTKEADKKIKPYKATVTGILEGEFTENSWTVIMPLKDLEKIVSDQEKYQQAKNKANGSGNNNTNRKKKGTYEQAMVKVRDMKNVENVQKIIKDMGYEAHSLTEYLNSMQESTKMLQMGLGAIGAMSLFVAAIGIANTMIMSIYERTKEIGVMKVIGASLPDIRGLFLIEAAFIGFCGGFIGISISLGVSKVINIVGAGYGQAYEISLIPIWLTLAALVFATFVGIAAGYFPAQRAMRLSALTAIKTE